MKNVRILFATLVCALAYLAPARATSVLPLYLDEVIDTAAVAFEGKCVGNRTERDPATNLVVTYTTFAVSDVLKGAVGSSHVIKQIGGTSPDERMSYRVQGVPTFRVGDDYVVFLAGVSAAGFSSPIGLSQGRFGIAAQSTGRRVSNGRDFRDLTARISSRLPAAAKARMQQGTEPVRDMDLAEFKQMVRDHVGAAR